MAGAGERDHRIAINERRKSGLRFVRRPRRRDEINRVQMEAPLRRLRHSDVPGVNRIERAAKQRDRSLMPAGMRLRGGMRTQFSSGSGAAWLEISASDSCAASCGTGSSEALGGAGFGIVSSASAIERTSSTTPSPVAAEIE